MSSLSINPVRLKQLRLRIERDTFLFPGMKKLKFRGKDLQNLPEELFFLEDLDVLDLGPEREACMEFRLKRIPLKVGQMKNLKVLIADLSGITVVPDELSSCCSLEKLCLSNNMIRDLPDSLSKLQNLTTLHMGNNKLRVFPGIVCNLNNLEFLDFSCNKITNIPVEISNLKKLVSFIIYKNHLRRIPREVGKLTDLCTFWIGDNKITRLPKEMTLLVKLDWGLRHTPSTAVDGNPLIHPPISVCKQGLGSIAEYFEKNPT